MGWSDPADRFTRAVIPTIGDISKPTQLAFDLWITPPEYTGQPPLFPLRTPTTSKTENAAATTPSPGILKVPAGSVLTAQIQGARNAETTLIAADKKMPFEKVDSAYSKIIFKIGADGEHLIATGEDELARLNIQVTPDNPPEIEFSEKPAVTPQATLRLSYKAKDDYGVKQAHIEIRRVYERGTVTGLAVHKVVLPLTALSAKKINETTFIANAKMQLVDFEKKTNFSFNVNNVDTLGGYVFSIINRVPQKGEIIKSNPIYTFEILDADPRKIKVLKIYKS